MRLPLRLDNPSETAGQLPAARVGLPLPPGSVPADSLVLRASGVWRALADPGTPTGSADPRGAPGDVWVDDSFLYVRTASGWRRAALTTF